MGAVTTRAWTLSIVPLVKTVVSMVDANQDKDPLAVLMMLIVRVKFATRVSVFLGALAH